MIAYGYNSGHTVIVDMLNMLVKDVLLPILTIPELKLKWNRRYLKTVYKNRYH